MDRSPKQKDSALTAARPDRKSAARFAREEAADVLAEALWSLLCAGRWPGSGAGGAPPVAAALLSERAPNEPQPLERTGL